MKKALTIGLAAAVLTATLSLVGAGAAKRDNAGEGDALPVNEILNTVRAMGLNPAGDPIRRGPYYVLHAYDPHGTEVRVVADAHFGEVLSVVPVNAVANAYAPAYQRGPRIIHVPQPGDRQERASVRDADEPDVSNDDEVTDIAPPPRRVTKQPPARIDAAPPRKPSGPRWKPRSSDAPPLPPPLPPGPRRAVLSAPPPTIMGPTPIKPTPKFGAKEEASDKFGTPAEPSPSETSSSDTLAATPPLPPGYQPPAGLPQTDSSNAQ